eukprot:NODE_1391_length_880_cov_121.710491_g1345_i0.p1 GENE.NODE_1391_length_880_cov_121.710491_g1345_i0~~NODE_1391_length_880_cov_121.710491_g1345_i0.p1  ORF type:complete len:245 (+),score=75.94 NODE_1391_length_880_cov_121.710491_g1345_i0:57-791(+)
MKLNIACPNNGTQKVFDIEDEKKWQLLNEKRIGQEFEGGFLGDEFKGYVFRITGGQDKQGFPMMQGIAANARVSLLLRPGQVGCQRWRCRVGDRRRKSVRGCIVAGDIASLNLIVMQKGEGELEGLTDVQNPRRLGPKRASKIRKLFALGKEDDVRKFVIKRTLPEKEGKKARTKAPKIQRLVTPVTLQRKRAKRAAVAARRENGKIARQAYQEMLDHRKNAGVQRKKALARRKEDALMKKRSS